MSLLTGADLLRGGDMKPQNDLADARRSIETNWSAYAWLIIIFAAIALCGRLIGQYIMH